MEPGLGSGEGRLLLRLKFRHRIGLLVALAAAELLTATSPGRRGLAAAFPTARDSQQASLWIDIAVAISVLALMAFLSWRLIRRTVQSLQAVSMGVERLAHGDFGHEIDVTPGDEIGDL